MAGNFRSGRKPAAKPIVDTAPKMPRSLKGEARAFWVRNIATAKHLSADDSDLARACCELWQLYRKAFELADADPSDKDARLAVSIYYQRFSRAAERLALDPLGRLRANQAIDKPADDNPLQEFGIVS